ncbi:hypothetical protein V5P93_000144 [Actinokineospora auranticolor]|uniref:Uncharacterized protein n=1 Tax=Actinokineospora auranticolor TaxID=155976 RepID=A0A2S6GL50_9PSEU|nr:hypothetical protein [Actinokineospora auranticolor]PPK65962.1 hypothetical protein CLV40_112230 [Actinokineospora auranticolor]
MTDNDRPQDPGDRPVPAEPEPKPQVDGPAGGESSPPPYVPPEAEEGATEPRKRGSVNYQDGTTKPKQPSVAEQRARREALRKQREEEQAAIDEAERKRKKRKRLLIGSGVTVGVVALVAVIYAASTPDEVTARCVDGNGVVVDDDYCDDGYATSHGGYHSGGFIYIGGSSYRYNYGGSGSVGQKATGGTYVAPSADTSVKTSSGKSVSRGGLGVSGGGKSGGS